ncbi:hypothetical protein I9W82_005181 [Candida metapsilosis]|uniref:Uncharacterized protein n=1 Tax=Candida metapsilosis TaxID=273372 RepID=A0A8H8DA56_9ASCO|nr:hypothetical protein I9W82_005181 [Candida metapsilosis]
MDTTESSNEADRRSATPQPQEPQTSETCDVHVMAPSYSRSIGDISDPICHQVVESSMTEPQSQRGRSTHSCTLSSSNQPRTPSPQTLPPPISNKDGTFANFQLPNDILKNLTPIIKSPPRDKTKQHTRKQAYIRNLQLKVSTRNTRVEKQLKNWKRQQQEYIRYQSAKLTESLQSAKVRREEYLQLVRERAVKFVKAQGGTSSVDFKEVVLSPPFRLTDASESRFWLIEHDEAVYDNVAHFQRICKRNLFKRHVLFLQNSEFLTKYESMPFNQILSCFNTESSIKKSISFVLKYLGIVSNQFELKMFLYCFIMIADFNDCMLNGPHPGFNYNSEMKSRHQEKTNTAKNCIWVMLYKLTTRLLDEFKQVVNTSPKLSLKFYKYWNDYKFVFKIFKWNHFVGIKHLLYSSISIVEEQISRIANDDDLHRQRTKLNMELSLLNKYNLADLKDFNESSQAVQFISLVSEAVEEMYANLDVKSPSFIQNQPNFICFDLVKFYVPDFIPIKKWRLYWMEFFFKEFDADRSHPRVLKTGYLGSTRPKTRNVDYISLADSLMDMSSFTLSQTYDILYDYYLEFSGAYTLPRVLGGVDDLRKLQHLIKHYDKKLKLVQFTGADLDEDEVLQLKYSVVIMWLQKCQFNKFDDFINFENLYTIINLKNFKNLRYSIYTQNPNLLFPEFYKLVMKFHSLDVGSQLRNIVYASFKNNLNKLFRPKPNFNQETFVFFNRVFNHMIVYNDLDNELSSAFKDIYSQLHTRLMVIVRSNAISLMFHSFTGTRLSMKCIKEAVADFTSLPKKQFVDYYKNHGDKICNILFEKWQSIIQKAAEGAVSFNNLGSHLQTFLPELTQDAELLSLEVFKFNQFLYKLYMPILNWIYNDLGPNGEDL